MSGKSICPTCAQSSQELHVLLSIADSNGADMCLFCAEQSFQSTDVRSEYRPPYCESTPDFLLFIFTVGTITHSAALDIIVLNVNSRNVLRNDT